MSDANRVMDFADGCSDPWAPLEVELNRWAALGQQASFWWRDDDAVMSGEKLDRLIDLTVNSGVLLASIPAKVDNSLALCLADSSKIWIAQHGYAHINHAPRGQGLGAWELGLHRGESAVLEELDEGRHRLEHLFGPRFLPVIVPPWNRIASELFKPIAERGYHGVSAFGARANIQLPSGLVLANAHCDPIRWKAGAIFAGEIKTLGQLVDHLEARRMGQVDVKEHTGFLTHHIDLDSAGWTFCNHLASVIENHSGARWISPVDVFGGQS